MTAPVAQECEGEISTWLSRWVGSSPSRGAILVHVDSSSFQAPGGGEVQLSQTARYLERLGVRVRPFIPWVDRIESARLLHLFGMSREGLSLARIAKRRGVPVVISPICWYEPSALRDQAADIASYLKAIGGYALRRVWPRCRTWRSDLLSLADRVLPNSVAEGRQLERLFPVVGGRIRVVPNGVESRFARATPVLFREMVGESEFVLGVGRIEPRKNTLGLIRAIRRLGLQLVLIGSIVPGYEGYGRACREAGRGFVRWIGRLDHADPRLASAYAAARVFALPSWFETPGLSALEAATAGTAVVITPHGCTREYFGADVEYARPNRTTEIAEAIVRAWDSGGSASLRERILNSYSWNDVARRTVEVYHELSR